MKHTPGPWEAKFQPFAPSYEIGVRAPNGSLDLIASLKDSVAQGNEREANARLIAAAPELLSALQVLEREMSAALTDGAYPEQHKAVAHARTALAKAQS